MTAEPTSLNLRQLIQQHFSLEDLRTLCLDLAIDYDELGEGIRKSTRVANLLQYVRQRDRLDHLLNHLRQQRPAVEWPQQLIEADLGLEPGRLVNVPPLPPHFLPRETELATLRQKALAESPASVAITGQSKAVGVPGAGRPGCCPFLIPAVHSRPRRRPPNERR
ncbi:MAG: hypothetical protein L0332_33060 [Chloroflexi bacterium]|nr:hypothetical protein [Chloroflexota bacterium]